MSIKLHSLFHVPQVTFTFFCFKNKTCMLRPLSYSIKNLSIIHEGPTHTKVRLRPSGSFHFRATYVGNNNLLITFQVSLFSANRQWSNLETNYLETNYPSRRIIRLRRITRLSINSVKGRIMEQNLSEADSSVSTS